MSFANKITKEDYIHIGGGLSTFPTPKHILDAMKNEINRLYDNLSTYGPPNGTLEFREAIAEYQKQWDVEVYPENVIVTAGAQQGAFLAVSSLVKGGGELLVTNPGFESHYDYLTYYGIKPKIVPRYEEKEWKLDPKDIEKSVSSSTKGIILCNPDNPTGDVINNNEVEEIAKLAKKHDLVIIQEQMYNRMIWGKNKFHSFAADSDMLENTIIVDSLSKTYAMPGWRLGYIISPERFMKTMTDHLWQISAGTNLHIQKAGTVALSGSQDYVNSHIKEYEERLDYAFSFWDSLDGVTLHKPKGGYYVFPDISSYGLSSKDFVDYISLEANVGLNPGCKYGSKGEGYIRHCTSFSVELQEEAFSRIEKALDKLKK